MTPLALSEALAALRRGSAVILVVVCVSLVVITCALVGLSHALAGTSEANCN
jgi:hypothetical protein